MTAAAVAIARPCEGDHAPWMAGYVSAAPDLSDAVRQLTMQRDAVRQKLTGITRDTAASRYAEGKWSVREVVGHLSDAERVFQYRLLRIGRGDETPLAGFDENAYVPAARFEDREFGDVLEDWVAVRNSTLALVKGLPPDAWGRAGVANGRRVTAAALAYVIYGHVAHHVRLLRERYALEQA